MKLKRKEKCLLLNEDIGIYIKNCIGALKQLYDDETLYDYYYEIGINSMLMYYVSFDRCYSWRIYVKTFAEEKLEISINS